MTGSEYFREVREETGTWVQVRDVGGKARVSVGEEDYVHDSLQIVEQDVPLLISVLLEYIAGTYEPE